MQYAVIKIGNQQYKVKKGDQLRVEKLPGKTGDKLVFDQVLLLIDGEKRSIGQPLVEGAAVNCTLVDQKKDKKLRVAVYKAKSRYRKVKGHRQQLTEIKIEEIKSKAAAKPKKTIKPKSSPKSKKTQ